MKYMNPTIELLIFDEEEILTESVKDYAQGQAVKFMLGDKVNSTNSQDGNTSAMIGVDVREIHIKSLD